MKYDYHLLQEYCKNNNVELSKNYSNEKVTCETRIEGKCVGTSCDEYFCRPFHQIVKCGVFCKKCTKISRLEKTKQTNMEKYGVENPFQTKEIKEKRKQTYMEKYGVEHPLQNKEIKEKMKQTNMEKYGVEHPSQNKEIKEKMKQISMEKYGVEHPSQNKEIKEKSKETNMEKYGVENPSQNKEIKEKMKQTCMKNFGVENPSQNKEIKEKMKQTCMKNFGVEHPLQNKEIKEKSKETCMEKYGVEYPLQNAEVSKKSSKNSYKLKNYIFPSGNTIQVQGYEPFGLDELITTEQISETDIVTNRTEVPTIWYEDTDGKKHRYFVDIFIPSQKRCIEVKSTWTMEKKRDSVFEKQQAMKDAGYECDIWVYNRKGEKIECHK
jgi:hypothetical protein